MKSKLSHRVQFPKDSNVNAGERERVKDPIARVGCAHTNVKRAVRDDDETIRHIYISCICES